jgi:hypothetical protein
MAVTTIQSNNKLIQFTRDINREFVRKNLFSPYMGEGLDAIIRIRQELKQGGEQMNIPLVTKLNGLGKATGVSGRRRRAHRQLRHALWLDWWRHAVVTTKAENQKDSADIFGEAKPLLSDRGKELQRDELIQASWRSRPNPPRPIWARMKVSASTASSSATFPTSAQRSIPGGGQRRSRRVRQRLSNHYSTTAIASATSALSVIGSVKLTATTISLLKRRAELCSPKIRPYKTEDGYEYYVLFAGTYAVPRCEVRFHHLHRQQGRSSSRRFGG